jgi:hypothetical protein
VGKLTFKNNAIQSQPGMLHFKKKGPALAEPSGNKAKINILLDFDFGAGFCKLFLCFFRFFL